MREEELVAALLWFFELVWINTSCVLGVEFLWMIKTAPCKKAKYHPSSLYHLGGLYRTPQSFIKCDAGYVVTVAKLKVEYCFFLTLGGRLSDPGTRHLLIFYLLSLEMVLSNNVAHMLEFRKSRDDKEDRLYLFQKTTSLRRLPKWERQSACYCKPS